MRTFRHTCAVSHHKDFPGPGKSKRKSLANWTAGPICFLPGREKANWCRLPICFFPSGKKQIVSDFQICFFSRAVKKQIGSDLTFKLAQTSNLLFPGPGKSNLVQTSNLLFPRPGKSKLVQTSNLLFPGPAKSKFAQTSKCYLFPAREKAIWLTDFQLLSPAWEKPFRAGEIQAHNLLLTSLTP